MHFHNEQVIHCVPRKPYHKLELNQKPTVLHCSKTNRTKMPKILQITSLKGGNEG